tara:strand:+ start:618 stop:1088 length:471 start_codon:yes stop_codon:yes gene_type:complete
MTKDEALKLALEALDGLYMPNELERVNKAILAINEALAQPAAQAEPVLQDIEQYRMQMAAICTAAIGYWTAYDSISPEYDTLALRDVAKLYAKYDALYKAQPVQEPVGRFAKFTDDIWHEVTDGSAGVPLYTTPPPCPTCEALARTVMMDQTGRDA